MKNIGQKIIILFLCFFFIFTVNLGKNINAEIIDGRYTMTFEYLADGQTYADDYIEGERWINVTGTAYSGAYETPQIFNDQLDASNNVFGYFDDSNTKDGRGWYNMSFYTTFINLTFNSYWSDDSKGVGFSRWYTFYSGSNALFRINHYYGGTPDKRVQIIDSDLVTQLVLWRDGTDNGISYNCKMYINIYLNNNSYRIRVHNDSTPADIRELWINSADPFGTITDIDCYYYSGSVVKHYIHTDNISIIPFSDLTDLYGLDNTTVGDLTVTGAFASSSPITYALFDWDLEDFNVAGLTASVKQFGIKVPNNLTLTNITGFYLKINDQLIGSYDTTYTSGDDYLLFWTNINENVTENDLIIELLLVFSSPTSAYWYGYDGDIDDDGDEEYKYTIGAWAQSDFNGVMDGDNNNYQDFLYQIWYDYNFTAPADQNETTPAEYTFRFKFYDILTNNILHFKGSDVNVDLMGGLDYVDGLIFSNITTNGLHNNYSLDDYIEVTATFVNGGAYTFYIMQAGYTNIDVRIDNVLYTYKMYTTDPALTLYEGQTYNIYLMPLSYYDGVTYTNCGVRDETKQGLVEMCLNKVTYDYGETLRLRYKLPSSAWLYSHDWRQSGWYITFYNMKDLFHGWRWDWDMFITRRELTSADFDGEYHTLELNITNYNNRGFKTYYNKYEIAIWNFNTGLFESHELLASECYFYVTGATFQPNGTITSITPSPAYFGQDIQFAFTSNGVGHLDVKYGSNLIFSVPYGYSAGTHTITRQISEFGTFSVELYTAGGIYGNASLVDSDVLTVNPLGANGTYGSIGYGVAYLYIPRYPVIAGNSTINIFYRTYKNDSILEVLSPRNEVTYFSTTVDNTSDNVLSFFIQDYMQIGTYNVTLYGGDVNGNNVTLNSSFNVVNEEGNWIEFTKNIYNTNEQLAVYLKHTYRVALTFYKNNIAQGTTIILQSKDFDDDILVIKDSIVPISAGNWRVEMWRINDRNRVYELAEWECRVIYAPPSDETGFGGGTLLPHIAQPLGSIIGLIITVFCLLIPLIVSSALKIKHGVPSLIYAFTGGLGIAISTILGLFPYWIPLFIVVCGIIFIVIAYLTGGNIGGTKSGGSDEKIKAD